MAKNAEQSFSIRINAGGDIIPANIFMEVLRASLAVLEDIDGQVMNGKPSLSWGFSRIVKTNPIECTMSARVRADESGRDDSREVVGDFLRGLRVLQEDGDRPNRFRDASLQRFRKLPLHLNGVVKEIRLYADGIGDVSLNLSLTSNIDNILGKEPDHYYETTSMTGKLIGVLWEKEEEPKLWIEDGCTGKKARCVFLPGDMDRAAEALKHHARILVHGRLRHNKAGEILRMEVEHWEVMPSMEDLPQAEDFRGIDILGGEPPEVSIRRGRDAN